MNLIHDQVGLYRRPRTGRFVMIFMPSSAQQSHLTGGNISWLNYRSTSILLYTVQ
jgi:hypothetical protein